MSEIREERRKIVSSRMQELLAINNVTASELSRRAGINRALVSRYLSGVYVPSDKNAQQIADAFGVSVEWLQGKDDTGFSGLADIYNELDDEEKELLVNYARNLKKERS